MLFTYPEQLRGSRKALALLYGSSPSQLIPPLLKRIRQEKLLLIPEAPVDPRASSALLVRGAVAVAHALSQADRTVHQPP